ncbi:DUF4129 domain-containing protein [Microbacterium sp. MC2]
MTPIPAAPPLAPDGDQAREWAEAELADPVYRAAEPTPFDRFAQAVGDFFANLFSGSLPESFAPWLAVVVAVVIVAVVIAAVVVWGRPRPVARSRRASAVLAHDETVAAAELRRRAEAAAAACDWDDAIVLRFRALARELAERTLLDPVPGTTVHGFARAAAALFPAEKAALAEAAAAFDDVRYLRRPGTEAAYRRLSDLDRRMRRAPAEAVPA